MPLTAPPQQQTQQDDDKKKSAPTRTIVFEGKEHEFPADATDDEIQQSLSSLPKQSPATTAATSDQPNSFFGGMSRRAGSALEGLYQTVWKPPSGTAEEAASDVGGPGGLALYRTGKGAVEGFKQKATEVAGDIAGKKYGKAALGFAELDPTSPISTLSPTSQVVDTAAEGRYREALGMAAFDALTTWMGMKMGKAPTGETQLNRLTAAVGDTGTALPESMPAIAETAKVQGPPNTLGDLVENVKQSKARVDQEFNRAIAPVSKKSIMPAEVANRIRALETPNMTQTPEGRETIKYIKKMAREYEKPWTVNQLNAERVAKNKELSAYYNKSLTGQIAAKSSIDTAIDKAIRDGSADAVYREIEQHPANAGMDVTELKKQHGALLNLESYLDDHVTKLENAERARKGTPLTQKVRPGTYLSAHGIHGYVSHLDEALPGGGALGKANVNVRRAFGSSTTAKAARAAVLSLPIANALAAPGFESSKFTPPPNSGEPSE